MARPAAAAASRPAPQSQQQGKGSSAQLTEQPGARSPSAAAAPSAAAVQDPAATSSALSAARAVAARIAQSRQGPQVGSLGSLYPLCHCWCCTCAWPMRGQLHGLQGRAEVMDEEALQGAPMENTGLQSTAGAQARRA